MKNKDFQLDGFVKAARRATKARKAQQAKASHITACNECTEAYKMEYPTRTNLDTFNRVNWMDVAEEGLGNFVGGGLTCLGDRVVKKWIIKDGTGDNRNKPVYRAVVTTAIGGVIAAAGQGRYEGANFVRNAGKGMIGASGKTFTEALLGERLDTAFANLPTFNLFGNGTTAQQNLNGTTTTGGHGEGDFD